MMPWKCPACETAIRHDGAGPAANRVYRCPVCRLELTLDPRTNEMEVTPLPTDDKLNRRKGGNKAPGL
jgi:hypothetical protein